MTATTDRLQALKTQPGFYIGKLSPRFILFGTSSRNGYLDVIFYSSGQDSDDIVRIVKRSACFGPSLRRRPTTCSSLATGTSVSTTAIAPP